jgi:hypothetical protein
VFGQYFIVLTEDGEVFLCHVDLLSSGSSLLGALIESRVHVLSLTGIGNCGNFQLFNGLRARQQMTRVFGCLPACVHGGTGRSHQVSCQAG